MKYSKIKKSLLYTFPKQGNKIEGVVLDRVCILGFLVLNSVKHSNFQQVISTQILVKYPLGCNHT